MLNFDYYFVDLGENYCAVFKRNAIISLLDAFKEKNRVELTVAKEFIIHKFKKNTPLFSVEEFKLVFVNKQGLLRIETEVINLNTSEKIEPIADTAKHTIYMMLPGQRLDMEYQVYQQQIEHRSLEYSYIRDSKSKAYKKHRR